MTGQDVLNVVEILHPELELQSGEVDVPQGLIALNIAQDQFEALLASHPGVLGGTVGTVTTAAGVETTAFPAGLLRLDRLQCLDPSTGRPAWDLVPSYVAGGQASGLVWGWASGGNGRPSSYWTDGTNIYWDPLPDGIYTVRYIGFGSKADITADGAFLYPDICRMPFATLAAKIIRIGVDDVIAQLDALTTEIFGPVLHSLVNFRREGGKPYTYTRLHDT